MLKEGEYIVAIDGKEPRDQIELQLQGEEAGNSEFVASETGTYKGVRANLVTFREVDDLPNDISLAVVPAGTPAPGGKTRLWEGKMLIDGTEQQAALYRDV